MLVVFFFLFIGGLFHVSALVAPSPPAVLSKDFQLLPSCFHSGPWLASGRTSSSLLWDGGQGPQGGRNGKGPELLGHLAIGSLHCSPSSSTKLLVSTGKSLSFSQSCYASCFLEGANYTW